jgi:hypothetical protein
VLANFNNNALDTYTTYAEAAIAMSEEENSFSNQNMINNRHAQHFGPGDASRRQTSDHDIVCL